MKKVLASVLWIALAVAGALAYGTIAFRRGEPPNSIYILIAALCSYAIGYRFYSKWIAARLLMLDDRRATPCEVHDDGKDFCKTNKWIVFGHHFAAISGPGPLVGPVLAAQFGYLPGTLWILIGVVLGGAVQDFVILFASLRRNGKSLGQMVKEELNTPAGYIALVAILAIMVILLAVLALVVVKALAESPWGIFTVGATIPIALFMGNYLRFWRVGKVMEASAIGVVLLLLGVWGGKLVYESAQWSQVFALRDITLAWSIILYGLAASVLPVWLLLAPRDYLSTFMKLGTIFALAVGIFFVLPTLRMPALTQFTDGSGPVVAGKVFPFCFITIACGAISGFHTLIASGTTPKMITRESYARPIGYGAMCLESLVAIMAMIAACTLDPGIYLSMNVKGAAATTVANVTAMGFPVTVEHMDSLARELGEKTLFGRTGGAATLAVGMAQIFSRFVSGHGLDLWYHFAIMFEALFILTTIDAGTRVARYILQDFLGNVYRPLADTRNLGANLLASGLMVCGWGYFLIQGVRDPHGGINSLWPLFGIANQMLAAIALCLATTIILKMTLQSGTRSLPVTPGADSPADMSTGWKPVPHSPGQTAPQGGTGILPVTSDAGMPAETTTGSKPVLRSPAIALVTLIPLVWLLAATMSAGAEKIWHPDPRIGFLAQAKILAAKMPDLEAAAAAARASGDANAIESAAKALATNYTLRFNNLLDAVVAGVFLALVTAIVLLSIREWILLLARKKIAELHETPPVWLPAFAAAQSRPLNFLGLIALSFALARELSGEAQLERAQLMAASCHGGQDTIHSREEHGTAEFAQAKIVSPKRVKISGRTYAETTASRFNGVKRCC